MQPIAVRHSAVDVVRADLASYHATQIARRLYRLIIFDWDGTLAETATGRPFALRADDWRPMRERVETLALLRAQSVALAIASNQGGIAFGHHEHDDWTRALRVRAQSWFGIAADAVAICPHHAQGTVAPYAIACRCRKPRGGMLTDMRALHGVRAAATLYVGDRETDALAARADGCDFAYARDLFADEQRA